MRMKKIISWGSCFVFFFLFFFSFVSHYAHAQEAAELLPESSLHATAAALIDADSGRVLYGKNADRPMAMASTTKIMTCIIILENVSLDDTLSVSPYASSMPKVKLYLSPGEQYMVRDLLYSLMLESHNDSAVALAEYVGRKYLSKELGEKPAEEFTEEESRQAVSAFARLMNEKAVSLGCKNTWFITPNGLDATQEFTLQDGTVIQKEHCTTAAELARIMAYCVRESPAADKFLEITRTQSYAFSANGRSFSCTNHNAFLNMMEGSLSGKTGFTNKAGYCYVAALERDGRTFAVALLACGWPNNKTWKWSDTKELMQYGIENYFYRSFSEEGVAFDEGLLKPVPVRNGRTDILGGTAYTDVEIEGRDGGKASGDLPPGETSVPEGAAADEENSSLAGGRKEGLLLREDETIQVRYTMAEALKAPVAAGTEVGSVEYIVDGVVYKTERIVTADRVDEINLSWCMGEILSRYLLLR